MTQDLVGPLATINEWRDIANVFPANSHRKLREMPTSINPVLVSGGIPRFIYPSYLVPGRPFGVAPRTAAGSVYAWCRQRPKLPLALQDKVYIDQLLLQYDACWMYAVDDGTIPAQVNKFQVLAQNRRKMVKASFAQHPIELDPRQPSEAFTGIEDTSFFVLDQTHLHEW